MPLEVEAVEQRLLRHRPFAHHRLVSVCSPVTDWFVDLSNIREHLRPFYSATGRLSRCAVRRRDASAAQAVGGGRSRGALDCGERERAFFAYATNYLIDLEHAVIDVEATTAVRQRR